MRLYDAHNHLQDDRLTPRLDEIVLECRKAGIVRMVVNGSCEQDWPKVALLARRFPEVLPSFGYHPWHVQERTPDWQRELTRWLDELPSAMGEVGLDKWILESQGRRAGQIAPIPQNPASMPEQEEVFVWQLRLAAERNLPLSIHCLQAWGPLLEILRREPRPQCGFVLHSYGGSPELVAPLAKLGAYFSLPGYFAHEHKHRQRASFRVVPPERLLIETDAPYQNLPEARNVHRLTDAASGSPINHPANLAAVCVFAGEILDEPLERLSERVEENFRRLFIERVAIT